MSHLKCTCMRTRIYRHTRYWIFQKIRKTLNKSYRSNNMYLNNFFDRIQSPCYVLLKAQRQSIFILFGDFSSIVLFHMLRFDDIQLTPRRPVDLTVHDFSHEAISRTECKSWYSSYIRQMTSGKFRFEENSLRSPEKERERERDKEKERCRKEPCTMSASDFTNAYGQTDTVVRTRWLQDVMRLSFVLSVAIQRIFCLQLEKKSFKSIVSLLREFLRERLAALHGTSRDRAGRVADRQTYCWDTSVPTARGVPPIAGRARVPRRQHHVGGRRVRASSPYAECRRDDATSGVSPDPGPPESAAQMSFVRPSHRVAAAARTVFFFATLLLTAATRCESGQNGPVPTVGARVFTVRVQCTNVY